jgi:hypothetical protein
MGVDSSDATHEFEVSVAGEFGGVNGVEVVKDWTVSVTLSSLVIAALGRPPEDFGPEAEVVPEKHIAAKARKCAASERWFSRTRRRRNCGADAEPNVDFLGLCDIRQRRRGSAGKQQNNGNT